MPQHPPQKSSGKALDFHPELTELTQSGRSYFTSLKCDVYSTIYDVYHLPVPPLPHAYILVKFLKGKKGVPNKGFWGRGGKVT